MVARGKGQKAEKVPGRGLKLVSGPVSPWGAEPEKTKGAQA